jgi:hypothetical protein
VRLPRPRTTRGEFKIRRWPGGTMNAGDRLIVAGIVMMAIGLLLHFGADLRAPVPPCPCTCPSGKP